MRGFKNNVSEGWFFKQELRFFRNFMRNWDRDVGDCDFFDIFANMGNTSEDEAVRMIGGAFSRNELQRIRHIQIDFDPQTDVARSESGPEGGKKERPSAISLSLDSVDEILRDIWNQKGLRERCRAMLDEWCAAMEGAKKRSCRRKDPMKTRISEIARVIGLNDIERDMLTFSAVRRFTCFDDYPMGRTHGRHEVIINFAMALDCPVCAVNRAFAVEGRLRKYGVIDSDGDIEHGSAFCEYLEGGEGEMLEGRFYKKSKLDDVLPWDYYGKLASEHGDMLKQMISSARGRRGVNILLYGEPGTGKTSFTKTLAHELGRDLFEIRHGDKDGGNDSAQSRMTGIRICNGQVPQPRSMIMVDEADQLLRTGGGFFSFFGFGGNSPGSEKGVINSILDETMVPTIWISNAPAETMAESVRRRFDYSIRFDKLTSRQRRSIWNNTIAKMKLGRVVPPETVELLADKYQTNAGGIAMALENLKRMGTRRAKALETIDKILKPHCELLEIASKDDRLAPAKDYSLEGLNISGDIKLERIVEAVRKFRAGKDDGDDPDRPRMNLLLWGPPGTGKTEFVKYLGSAVNAKVSVKMGSDLISMWVGGTEKNIKRAFDEAEEDNAILFLDEIDGLVQDRSGANRSWEVTQVNELLHRMENFKGVMVGATNFMDNLDAAIMRRFTFKIQFDYLDDAGKRLFFERMFKTALSAEDAAKLAAVPNLAPGDFRTVRQTLYYLGGDVTNARRIDELARESSRKKDSRKSAKIGF